MIGRQKVVAALAVATLGALAVPALASARSYETSQADWGGLRWEAS
jgi:hypothetical protein